MERETILTPIEIKFDAGGAPGVFSGYGAVFGNVDSYDDVIQKGAFRDTLRDWKKKGRMPPMLVQHGGGGFSDSDGIPIGKWESMEEDSHGLFVTGRLINLDTERGKSLHGAMKAGVLDGMSIGFRVIEHALGHGPDEPRRTLKKVDLVELSVVTFPANESARVASIKSNKKDSPMKHTDELKEMLADQKRETDAALDVERKERESLEARINRQGIQVDAASDGEMEMRAINKVLRDTCKHGSPLDITTRLAEAVGEVKSLSVGSDPDGGYSVFSEFDTRIRTIARDQGALRRIAGNIIIGSDVYEYLLNRTIAETGWVGETEARPETGTPTLTKTSIPVHEIYSQPMATQKLIDDSSVDIGVWLMGEVGLAFGEKEAEAFITVEGGSKPRGLMTYPTAATGDAARAWGTVEHVPSGKAGGFADTDPADAILSLVYKLKAGYRQNAKFLMSSETAGVIRKMKDSTGRFLWQEPLTAGQPALLFGYEVAIDEYMPSIVANSLSIAFGDFQRGYQVVDRQGIKVLVDPYTSKPYVKWYSTYRVGGDVVDFNAIKFMRFATT